MNAMTEPHIDGCWTAKVAMMNSARNITSECVPCDGCGHCRHDHNAYAYSDTGSWCRFCDCFNPVYPRHTDRSPYCNTCGRTIQDASDHADHFLKFGHEAKP